MKITIDTTQKKVIIIDDCQVTELNDFLKKVIPAKELKDYQIENAPVYIQQPPAYPLFPEPIIYPQPWYADKFIVTSHDVSFSSFTHSCIHEFKH